MLSLVQRISLQGTAPSASRRGRLCVVNAEPVFFRSLMEHAAQQKGLELDEHKMKRLLSIRDPCIAAKVLATEFPELEEPITQLANERLAAPIVLFYKFDVSKQQMVPRSQLLQASVSCAAVEEFLKQQLGLPAQQKFKVTFSRGAYPGQAPEYELTEELFERWPISFIAGYAEGWFISDL